MRDSTIIVGQLSLAIAVLLFASGWLARKFWMALVATVGMAAFILTLAVDYPAEQLQRDRTDYAVYRRTANLVAQNHSPYDEPLFPNPPTLIPFVSLLAFGPEATSYASMLLVNSFLYMLLPWLVLKGMQKSGEDYPLVSPYGLALVVSCLMISASSRQGLLTGQFAGLSVVAIAAAFAARLNGYLWVAGALLAVASVKPQLSLPFFLLLLRRGDWKVWLAAMIVCLVLSSTAGGLIAIPEHIGNSLAGIARLSAEGQENDISYANPLNTDVVSMDYGIYRLGIRDRGVCKVTSYVILAVLAAGLLWRVNRPKVTPGFALGLAGLYASVFLYHRLPDMIVLVFPMVYSLSQARRSRRTSAKIAYIATIACVIGAWNVRIGLVRSLTDRVRLDPQPDIPTRLIEMFILPHGTWLVLIGLVAFVIAERLATNDSDFVEENLPCLTPNPALSR